MELLKKNWAKFAIALILTAAGVFAIIAMLQANKIGADLIDSGVPKEQLATSTLVSTLMYIGALVFFFGMAITTLLKVFAPKYAKFGYICVGSVCTILSVIVIVFVGRLDAMGGKTEALTDYLSKLTTDAGTDADKLLAAAKANYAYGNVVSSFWSVWAPLFVFGLVPLVMGIKKLVCKDDADTKTAA